MKNFLSEVKKLDTNKELNFFYGDNYVSSYKNKISGKKYLILPMLFDIVSFESKIEIIKRFTNFSILTDQYILDLDDEAQKDFENFWFNDLKTKLINLSSQTGYYLIKFDDSCLNEYSDCDKYEFIFIGDNWRKIADKFDGKHISYLTGLFKLESQGFNQ